MSTTQEFLLAFEQSKDTLALIVTKKDPSQMIFPDARGGLAQVTFSNETSVDDVLPLLADCARRGRWCRIDVLTADIPSSLYQALRSLAASGHVQYQKDGEAVEAVVVSGTKIVCVVSDEILNQISIPTFLNLFSIVHRE